jgi:hypothetical protein
MAVRDTFHRRMASVANWHSGNRLPPSIAEDDAHDPMAVSRPGGFWMSRMNERAQREGRQASHAQSLFAPFCG